MVEIVFQANLGTEWPGIYPVNFINITNASLHMPVPKQKKLDPNEIFVETIILVTVSQER